MGASNKLGPPRNLCFRDSLSQILLQKFWPRWFEWQFIASGQLLSLEKSRISPRPGLVDFGFWEAPLDFLETADGAQDYGRGLQDSKVCLAEPDRQWLVDVKLFWDLRFRLAPGPRPEPLGDRNQPLARLQREITLAHQDARWHEPLRFRLALEKNANDT